MYRIFIVEDDRTIAQAVAHLAENWGLEVRCVRDFRAVTAAPAVLRERRGAQLSADDQKLTYQGQTVELTKNEYRILSCLMESAGKVVSREKLMQRLWETDSFVDENTLTVNVNRLRRKLAGVGLVDFIATRHGVGYIVE